MGVPMRGLRDFRGREGEGTNLSRDKRFVEAGCEFTAADQSRADWLETMGHAMPVKAAKAPAIAPREAAVRNPAEEAGPLAAAGGGTGAADAASSSAPAPAPPKPPSARPKAARTSSRSTRASASPPSPKPSTGATGRGGGRLRARPASKG